MRTVQLNSVSAIIALHSTCVVLTASVMKCFAAVPSLGGQLLLTECRCYERLTTFASMIYKR